MPYTSDAQRRYFNAAAKRGDIPQKTVREFNDASRGEELPEYVKKYRGGRVSPLPKDDFGGAMDSMQGTEYVLDGHEEGEDESYTPYAEGGPVEGEPVVMRRGRPARYAKGGKIAIIHVLGSRLK